MKCLERGNVRIRPVGNGVNARLAITYRFTQNTRTWLSMGPNRIIPYPTGRIACLPCSRQFLPGYLHFVPTGQLRPFTVTILSADSVAGVDGVP